MITLFLVLHARQTFVTNSSASQSVSKSRIYRNGLYGWPLQMIHYPTTNTLQRSKWAIGVIDTRIDFNNKYLRNPHTTFVMGLPHRSTLHGTMVAGILSANGNGISSPRGMLPGVKLVNIAISSRRGTSISSLIAAIHLAIHLHLRVVNISLGTHINSRTLHNVVNEALHDGMCIIAAAGNNSSKHDDYPAAYSGVIAVAAVNDRGRLAANSNYEPKMTIGAPGLDLLTTSSSKNSVTWFSGSSAATPIVTSVCVSLLNKYPQLKPYELQRILLESAQRPVHQTQNIPIIDYKKALLLIRHNGML